jgi:hypothetical protein
MGRRTVKTRDRRYSISYTLPLSLIKQIDELSPDVPRSYVVEALIRRGLRSKFEDGEPE